MERHGPYFFTSATVTDVDGVVCRLAANVVRCDEQFDDARKVPYRYVQQIAVAIGDPIEARSQATQGNTRGVESSTGIGCEKGR